MFSARSRYVHRRQIYVRLFFSKEKPGVYPFGNKIQPEEHIARNHDVIHERARQGTITPFNFTSLSLGKRISVRDQGLSLDRSLERICSPKGTVCKDRCTFTSLLVATKHVSCAGRVHTPLWCEGTEHIEERLHSINKRCYLSMKWSCLPARSKSCLRMREPHQQSRMKVYFPRRVAFWRLSNHLRMKSVPSRNTL